MRRYTLGFALQPPGAAISNLSSAIASNVPRLPVQWVTWALNTLLSRQPSAQALLATHAGRTFHIHLGRLLVALTIGQDGALVAADTQVAPDVELKLDIGLLLRSGWMPGKDIPDLPGLVHVSGDAAMAQTLSTLARHWRPDLEDILSAWVGDLAAVQLTQGARSLFKGLLVAANKLTENVAEFLAYESRDLTPTPVMRSMVGQLHDHQHRLDGMNQSMASLTARVQALERRVISPLKRGDSAEGVRS